MGGRLNADLFTRSGLIGSGRIGGKCTCMRFWWRLSTPVNAQSPSVACVVLWSARHCRVGCVSLQPWVGPCRLMSRTTSTSIVHKTSLIVPSQNEGDDGMVVVQAKEAGALPQLFQLVLSPPWRRSAPTKFTLHNLAKP